MFIDWLLGACGVTQSAWVTTNRARCAEFALRIEFVVMLEKFVLRQHGLVGVLESQLIPLSLRHLCLGTGFQHSELAEDV